MFRILIASLLILYGVFGSNLQSINIPKPEPVAILNIEKPSDDIMSTVSALSSLIKDPTDRVRVAIFNYEFATRVKNYNTDLQKMNDVYTLAGKIFFNKELVNKYDGFGDGIIKLISNLVSDDNHDLSIEEKNKLSEYFMGLAWSLIQKQ